MRIINDRGPSDGEKLACVLVLALVVLLGVALVSCGKPDIHPVAIQPGGAPSTVACPVKEIPGSSVVYEGNAAMCKLADESAQGIESLEPVRIRCHRLYVEKCQ